MFFGHIAPHIGSVKLQKLSGGAINALHAKLAAEGKRDGKTGLSPRTIHHVHTCLHKACKDAVRWGRLSRNPVEAAEPPRTKGDGGREMKTWNAKQLKAFFASTAGDRHAALYHVLAMTGMRRGEVVGLRWDDVDPETGRLSVRRALIPHGSEVIISEPKPAKSRRSIALDPASIEALKAQAARQLDDQKEWGEAWSDSGYVFTKENGEPLHPQVVSRAFTQALKAARLPEIRLHDLRHTHATLALRAGIHARHLLARHPGDAGGGGGDDHRPDVREPARLPPGEPICQTSHQRTRRRRHSAHITPTESAQANHDEYRGHAA